MAALPTPAPADDLARLRRLIEHSTDMLSRHAPDGTCLYTSPACRELLGYEPEELIGRSGFVFVHPDDVADLTQRQDEVMAGARLHTVLCRVRDKEGRDVWIESTVHALRDPVTGAVVELLSSSRDVSERVTVTAQLRESEQRFRLAMNNAPIGMALVGLDGRFIEVNDSLCELLGRPRDELVELTFQDITHVEDLEADLDNASRLLAGEIHHYEMEKRYLHPSGTDVWALLSGSLVRGEDGEPLYFIAQVVDIGARRRALLALEHANRDLERSNAELHRFAAVAAHDLRSPLATVRGFLDLLGDRYAGFLDQQGQQILEVARRVTTQMAESVEGLLTLAAVGVDHLDVEVVDTQDVVDEVLVTIALGPRSGGRGARNRRRVTGGQGRSRPAASALPEPARQRHQVPRPCPPAHHRDRGRPRRPVPPVHGAGQRPWFRRGRPGGDLRTLRAHPRGLQPRSDRDRAGDLPTDRGTARRHHRCASDRARRALRVHPAGGSVNGEGCLVPARACCCARRSESRAERIAASDRRSIPSLANNREL
jgi:PAS domain S-box-containing protein